MLLDQMPEVSTELRSYYDQIICVKVWYETKWFYSNRTPSHGSKQIALWVKTQKEYYPFLMKKDDWWILIIKMKNIAEFFNHILN